MSKIKTTILIVFGCFFFSGMSALIFQTAWVKSLSLVFGTSYLAVATVLAAYMFGLALGAYLTSRYISRIQQPVLFYGFLEGVIATSGLLVPLALSLCQLLYIKLFGGLPEPVMDNGAIQSVFFVVATFIVLSIPTISMGATLPLLTKYMVTSDKTIGSGVGNLYFANTFGAVLGVLLSGFVLLPYLGLYGAMGVAALINVIIFIMALGLIRGKTVPENASSLTSQSSITVVFSDLRYLFSFATGVLSFSLEVYWTRLLSHVMGGTSYAFAIMLASFLSGIAIGGLVGGRLAKTRLLASKLYPISLLVVGLTSLLAYVLLQQLPLTNNLPLTYRASLSFLALFPAAFFLGATFPLLIRTIANSAAESSKVTAHSYAWNTLGAIIGAIATGFIILPVLGYEMFIKVVVIVFTALCLSYLFWITKNRSFTLTASISVFVLAIYLIPIGKPASIIYAHIHNNKNDVETAFYGVGRTSTILLHEDNGYYKLSSNGLSESAIGSKGMPPFNLSQKWLSGLPALARPNAEHFAIVGLGGGIAIQGVPPSAKSIDVFELEPMVTVANRTIGEKRIHDPLKDKRVSVIENDARNALLLTDKKYDIIVSQPSHPWTGGASHLYTAEFLQLVKSKMTQEGVFLQWINSQFIDEHLFRVLTSTLVQEFDYVELYQPERQVLMFVASNETIDIWNGKQNGLIALGNEAQHFATMGALNLEDIISMLAFENEGLRAIAQDIPKNTDSKNWLAYFTRANANGLSSEDILNHFGEFDPLLNDKSVFHEDIAATISLTFLAEKLIQTNFLKRASGLAKAASDPIDGRLIDALGVEYDGDTNKAREMFNSVLRAQPNNEVAKLGLLRLHLGDFSRLQLSPGIAKLANSLQGANRAVLESWVLGSTGRFEQMSALDGSLAQVPSNSLFYAISIKLRVDWRIWKSIETGDSTYAQQALVILDGLLASFWNIDLYMLRYQIAKQLDRPFEQLESLMAASEQLISQAKSGTTPDLNVKRERLLNAFSDIESNTLLESSVTRIEKQTKALTALRLTS